MKRIEPLGDRVVIRPDSGERTTAGGLVIPDIQKEITTGTVVAVGPGRQENGKLIALALEPGDRVVVARYGGTEFNLDDGRVLLYSVQDILGKVFDE